jgi:hypothetical protein
MTACPPCPPRRPDAREVAAGVRDARDACRVLAIALEATRAAVESIDPEHRPACLDGYLDGPDGVARTLAELRAALTRIERGAADDRAA